MKRITKAIFILALVFFSFNAFAAGITFSQDSVFEGGKHWEQITAICTADGSAAYPVTEIPYNLQGMYLFSVNTYYGATGPKEDTDLELLDAAAGNDILNGNGIDTIDNAADNDFKPAVDSSDTPMPIYTPIYIKISGNDVNAAIVTIVLKFIQ